VLFFISFDRKLPARYVTASLGGGHILAGINYKFLTNMERISGSPEAHWKQGLISA
jgi:hypothetical protein